MTRWMLVIVAVMASLAACGSDQPPGAGGVTTAASATDGCDSILPSTSVEGDGYEVHHTVSMQPEPITFELEPKPSAVCPGGDVRVTLRAHNAGPTIEGFRGQLSLGCGGMVKMMVAALGPITLPEGDSTTSVEFAAPAANCLASISVYGYAGTAQLRIGRTDEGGPPPPPPPFVPPPTDGPQLPTPTTAPPTTAPPTT